MEKRGAMWLGKKMPQKRYAKWHRKTAPGCGGGDSQNRGWGGGGRLRGAVVQLGLYDARAGAASVACGRLITEQAVASVFPVTASKW